MARSVRQSLAFRVILASIAIILSSYAWVVYSNYVSFHSGEQEFTEFDAYFLFSRLNPLPYPELGGIPDGVETFDNKEPNPVTKARWEELIAANPGFYYYVETQEGAESLNPPQEHLDLGQFQLANLRPQESGCLRANNRIEDGNSSVQIDVTNCKNGNYLLTIFGGISPNYSQERGINWDLVFMTTDALWLGFLVIFVGAAAVVWLISRSLLEAGARVADINAAHLNDDIPTKGMYTEIQVFVQKINAMIQSLPRSFNRERRFRNAMAHELRSPLTVIKSRVDRLDASAEKRQLLQDIDGLQEIISRLLALARIGAENAKLAEYDLRTLVQRTCAKELDFARSQGIELALDMPEEEAIWVFTNEEAVQLILSNLLRNAVQHSSSGGAVVDVAIKPNGLVAITDYGAGIPSERLSSIRALLESGKFEDIAGRHRLGLTIVAEAAAIINLPLSIAHSDDRGTRIELQFSK